MKKFSLCALLCMFSFNIIADQLLPTSQYLFKYKVSGKHEKFSQTFLFTRPAYTLIEARQFLAHEFMANKNCYGGFFQVVGMYQKAHRSEHVGRYFGLPERTDVLDSDFNVKPKNIITVKGDDVRPINRDVRAEWLGLGPNFEGVLSLEPEQMQWAAYLEYQQDFKPFTDNWLLSSFYFSFQLPVQHVKNDMNFRAPLPLLQAFNRPELLFSKIPTQSESVTSVPEIIFRLGSYFLKDDGFELGVYSMLLIPTAKSAKAEFLFDPFLGHNNHWGMGSGFNFQMPLNCTTDCRIFSFYVDLEHTYLFRATQHRTFDVRFKPWSRYMLVNSIYGECGIPAANVLTRRVRTEPFSLFEGSSGFRFYNEFVALQLGYSCYAQSTEWPRLKEPWLEEFGFAGVGGPGTDGLEVNCVPVCPTASESTISCLADNDVDEDGNLVFVPIRWQDLDFYSGGARAAVVNRAHVAVGFKAEGKYFSFFAGLGAFGEFPTLNTAFTQWGVWGKFGGTF
ncbi:MAG: hypothetical protein AB7F19_05090 [Candidatus Babeliales bacterium]